MPDLLIFDCDGVLVDSEVLAREALQRVYAEHGASVSDDAVAGIVGMKMADILARLDDASGTTLPDTGRERIWPVTRDLFDARLEATDGLAAFLDRSALTRCVASSSHHERIASSLRTTQLDIYFPSHAIFSSQDVKRGKPAPDLFLHAAERMGVEPSKCLVMEDSRFGIAGAKAAGMTAWGYVGGSHLEPRQAAERLSEAGADWVAPSWAAARERLECLTA